MLLDLTGFQRRFCRSKGHFKLSQVIPRDLRNASLGLRGVLGNFMSVHGGFTEVSGDLRGISRRETPGSPSGGLRNISVDFEGASGTFIREFQESSRGS